MIVRLWRSSKWELILLMMSSSLLSLGVCGAGLYFIPPGTPLTEKWLAVAAAFVVINLGFGYWAGRRVQRGIDSLHLAVKQVSSGNLAVRLPEGGARSFTATFREFNEMAAALERKMKWQQREGEQQVMREAASNEAAILEERKRLARDLHDTVSQQLFAIHMAASSMPKLLELDRARADSVMQQLIDMSSMAQRQMRGFIAQLRPLELEGRSLQQALDKWFPDYCRQNRLQGELSCRVQGELSEAKEHQLFLIIQEAMANVVKHAGANKVILSLMEYERNYVMTLQDDGAGFRADQVKTGSYGLSTMRERSQKLGGDTEILSKPGSGTRIKVTIPKYEQEEQDDDERSG
ncbi:sensor histidine kinase [Paenibacillus sambharensis]|uniref:histidine kinase n=1 Tax=Paenibacillus sambharensis TaxID=1803190 RepID=A0A2W1L853_9BACL|nr:sensor histidine kinase [Paenibacillus sambharensis]PZD94320.1 sensor histidine kinase [Paenibacillus sambharensis]